MQIRDDQVAQALTAYAIQVAEVCGAGPDRYEISGPSGVFEGAILSEPAATWRAWITGNVWNSGFRDCQRPWMSVYQEPFVRIDEDRVFCLTDKAVGPSFLASPEEAGASGKTLALLHRALGVASGELPDAFWTIVPRRYGDWIRKLSQGYQVLASTRLFLTDHEAEARFDESRQEAFLQLIQFEREAKWSLEQLTQSGYSDYVKEAYAKREISWPSLTLSDFSHQLTQNRGYVRLTADPVFDTTLTNLATLCYDLSLEAEGAHLIQRCLTAYQEIRSLTKSELEMLRVYIYFPHYAVRWIQATHRHRSGLKNERPQSEVTDALVWPGNWTTSVLRHREARAESWMNLNPQRGGDKPGIG